MNIKEILKLSQEKLLSTCYLELINYNYKDIEYTPDYVYAKGDIPILLVAHCDIVHKITPEIIVHDKQKQILWSPTGIGGDDRCGVYAILKICQEFKPYVLFTTNEEVGGLGAKKFVEQHNKLPVNFIIEIDRRGNNQVVYYDCDNKDFQKYIESFGFEKKFGSYSDVCTLSNEYDIAGCNVSAGYYNEHTTTEHIYLKHLYNTINKIKNILNDKENHKFYDCKKIEYKCDYADTEYYYDENLGCYRIRTKQKEIKDGYELYNMYQKEEDYFSLTPEQWQKKYKERKPSDILEIYEDY